MSLQSAGINTQLVTFLVTFSILKSASLYVFFRNVLFSVLKPNSWELLHVAIKGLRLLWIYNVSEPLHCLSKQEHDFNTAQPASLLWLCTFMPEPVCFYSAKLKKNAVLSEHFQRANNRWLQIRSDAKWRMSCSPKGSDFARVQMSACQHMSEATHVLNLLLNK